jgi:hypothetical protein
MKRHGRIWHHIFLIPAAAVFLAVLGCAVMFLWNALLPRIAGLPPVNFWEAAGLLILARILFGGLGRMGPHHGHRNLFKEKWLNMSDEERKSFVTKLRGCHHHQESSAEDGMRAGSSSSHSTHQKKA